MSKSSLLDLQSTINSELSSINKTARDLKDLKSDVMSSMNDKVGASAGESIESIARNYTYYLESAYKKALNGTRSMLDGYNSLKRERENSRFNVSRAEELVRDLGKYE